MKILILLISLSSSLTYASCPLEIETNSKTYCAEIEWGPGQVKKGEDFQNIDLLSPLLSDHPLPQRWLYSSLNLFIWEKGNENMTPVEIPDFKLFPYMTMLMHHSHSASHRFLYDNSIEAYSISQWKMQEMQGCWSLRWTTDSSMNIDDSQSVSDKSSHLIDIKTYSNISEDKNSLMSDYCESGEGIDDHINHDHDHHHNH